MPKITDEFTKDCEDYKPSDMTGQEFAQLVRMKLKLNPYYIFPKKVQKTPKNKIQSEPAKVSGSADVKSSSPTPIASPQAQTPPRVLKSGQPV